MSTTLQEGGSAKIFQFPARGRYAASAAQSELNAASERAPRVSYGSWYHEEAIEAERARSN